MRAIFKLMLGLMLFNAVFTLYGPIFNVSETAQGVELDDPEITKYSIDKMDVGKFLTLIFSNGNALLATGLIGGVSILASVLTKNYVFIGVGIFIGVITGIYASFSSIISQLGMGVGQNSPYIMGIITIISIAIGLLAMFNIVDMMAPAPT